MFKKMFLPLLLSLSLTASAAPQIESKYIKDNAITTSKINAGAVDLTTKVTGTLPVDKGGTGQTTTSGSLNALLPVQTGNTGKYLQTDGSNSSWATVIGGGGTAAGILGSIQFSDGSGTFIADATNLFWDSTNNRLGIRNNGPTYTLDVGNAVLRSRIHNAQIGAWPSDTDFIFIGNDALDQTVAGNEALHQDNLGNTHLNSASGMETQFTIGGVEKAHITAIGFETAQGVNIRFSGATSGYIGLISPTVADNTVYVLPAADGTTGQVLRTDGSGVMSWVSAPSGTPSTFTFTDTYSSWYAGVPVPALVIDNSATDYGVFGSADALTDVPTRNILLQTGHNDIASSTTKTGDLDITSGNIGQASGSGNTGSLLLASGDNLGTGNSGVVALQSGQGVGGNSGNVTVKSSSANASTGTSGNVLVQTGGGDITGNVTLQTGTATTTRGKIVLLDGTETGAGAGAVWTQAAADGIGGWAAPSGVSFPLLAPNGTAGAPSYSFSGDSDVGFYYSGSSVGYAHDGIAQFEFNDGVIRPSSAKAGLLALGAANRRFTNIYTQQIDFVNSTPATFASIFNVSSPSGVINVSQFRGTELFDVGLTTANQTTASTNSRSVHVESGNATGTATSNSGGINLQTGTAANGTSGNISLIVGTGGTQGGFKIQKSGVSNLIGDVWTATSTSGDGYWGAPSASFPLLGSAGSNTAPTYSFSGDTNTGMYSLAADVLAFPIGGVNKFVISANDMNVSAGMTNNYLSGTAIIKFHNTGGGNNVTLRGNASQSVNTLFQLPPTNGSSGHLLQTDGAGITSWVAAPVSGADQQLSNLSGTTAVPVDLLPVTAFTKNLGNASVPWNSQFVKLVQLYDSGPTTSVGYLDADGGTSPSGGSWRVALNTDTGGAVGGLGVFTGVTSGAAASGSLYLETGNQTAALTPHNSGAVLVKSGNLTNVANNGNSGAINLTTGTVAGSGVRGNIVLDANKVSSLSTISPSSNNFYSLGESSLAWASIYGVEHTVMNAGSVYSRWQHTSTTPSGVSVNAALTGGDINSLVSRSLGIWTSTTASTSSPLYLETGNGTGAGGDSGLLQIKTGNITNAASTETTGVINITTGNTIGSVSGDSGAITLQTGTVVAGTRGKIKFVDGSTATPGFVWTSTNLDGSGTWQTAAAGANTNLSNLTNTVAIPNGVHIQPLTDNSVNLGSSALRYALTFSRSAFIGSGTNLGLRLAGTQTTPTTGIANVAEVSAGASEHLGLFTPSDSGSKNIYIETGGAVTVGSGSIINTTGNTTGGTSATGSITHTTGNSIGAGSGLITLKTGTGATTTGALLLETGAATTTSGAITLKTGTGATRGALILDAKNVNFTNAPIGSSLIPEVTNTISLGTSSFSFLNLFASGILVGGAPSTGGKIINTMTTPSGASAFGLEGVQLSRNVAIASGVESGISTTSGGLYLETGNSTGTTSSSGLLNLQTGTATSTSGNIILQTGNSSAAGSGVINLTTGTSVGASSGAVNVVSGSASGAGSSGDMSFKSGAKSAGTGSTGAVVVASGINSITTNNTGTLTLSSGNNTVTGGGSGAVTLSSGTTTGGGSTSGAVNITTGTAGGGTRGDIIFNARALNFTSSPVGTHFIPLTSNTYTLGEASAKWSEVWGTSVYTSNIQPSTSGTANITVKTTDSASSLTGNTFISTGDSTSTSPGSGNTEIRTGTSATGTSGAINLTTGTGTTRGDIVFNSRRVNFSNASFGSGLDPAVDNAYDVGNVTNYFRTVYAYKHLGSGYTLDSSTGPSGTVVGLHVNSISNAGLYSEDVNAANANSTSNVYIDSGNAINASSTGSSGLLRMRSGTPGALGGNSGVVSLVSGNAAAGNSGNIELTVGTASGGTRGDIIFGGREVVISGYGDFGTITTNTASWGSNLPGLTIDGASTAANTAGAAGIVMNDPTGVNFLFMGTNDRSGTGDTSAIYMTTGDQAGSGNSGQVSIYSGQATGGGDSGGVLIASQTSTSGNSGSIQLQSGPASAGASGDIGITTNATATTRGNVNIGAKKINATVSEGGTALPVWVKYTVEDQSLQTGGTTNDIELFSLPTKGVISGVVVSHSDNFAGGAIASYTISVGVAGNLTKYASAFDVFQTEGNTVQQSTQVLNVENKAAATSIRIAAVSTGANLSASTQGSVDVWVLWSILP